MCASKGMYPHIISPRNLKNMFLLDNFLYLIFQNIDPSLKLKVFPSQPCFTSTFQQQTVTKQPRKALDDRHSFSGLVHDLEPVLPVMQTCAQKIGVSQA